jgi:hypothetical protein
MVCQYFRLGLVSSEKHKAARLKLSLDRMAIGGGIIARDGPTRGKVRSDITGPLSQGEGPDGGFIFGYRMPQRESIRACEVWIHHRTTSDDRNCSRYCLMYPWSASSDSPIPGKSKNQSSLPLLFDTTCC